VCCGPGNREPDSKQEQIQALANWISFIALGIVPLAIVAYRIRVEEKALVETPGQPYCGYMTRTKRLIPFLF
jgi:protein-S-isoprenylcysteine O-methyltransferase Ste14